MTFKSCYLRNTFCKAIAAIDNNYSDGSGQSKWKTFCKGLIITGAVKNIYHSWEHVKISTIISVWEKLTPSLRDDFQGFRTSVEAVTANVVEIPRELEIQVELGWD